jgi:anti-anti-sigma factor
VDGSNGMTEPDLEVLRPRAGAAVLVMRGEHDLATRDKLAKLINGLIETDDLVVIDLSAVSFIDSAVLGVLVRADGDARAGGKRLRLQLGTSEIVERLLEITQLRDHLDCAPTREQALADS